MTIRDKAEAALEEALLNQNDRPLHNLIAMLVRAKDDMNADEIVEIRRDVYLGLAKLLNRGKTIPDIAPQFYNIDDNNRISYIRRKSREKPSVPFEVVAAEVERKLQDAVFDEPSLSPEVEEKCEIVARILSAMGSSGNEIDTKQYLAVVAAIAGDSPVEALRREFGPDIAANTAAQHKRRGIEQVKAQYQASKGRKAS